jgi:hypothetical protein
MGNLASLHVQVGVETKTHTAPPPTPQDHVNLCLLASPSTRHGRSSFRTLTPWRSAAAAKRPSVCIALLLASSTRLTCPTNQRRHAWSSRRSSGPTCTPRPSGAAVQERSRRPTFRRHLLPQTVNHALPFPSDRGAVRTSPPH